MLFMGKEWVEFDGYREKEIEYRRRDFYGPFVGMRMRQYKKGRIEITALYSKAETVEVSESQFSLLSKATKELYHEIGKFVLKTKLFEVTVDSDKTRELLLKKLMELKLF